MLNKISIYILGFMAISCMTICCRPSDNGEQILTIEQLIEQEIEKKLNRYRNIRIKKCEDKILIAAGKRADSMIIAQAKDLKVIQDSINRPETPLRPERPELLEPIDSTFPIPLLNEDSLFNDTIFAPANQ